MGKRALLVPRAPDRIKRALQPAGPARTMADFSAIYWSAAKKLAGDTDFGSLEDLPILFLYRHAVETSIKAVLIQAGVPMQEVVKHRHDLAKQMPGLRKVAQQHRLPMSRHFKDKIERWNESDPDGMRSRYPVDRHGKEVDKRGKPMLIANECRFHLRPFVEDAEQMLRELDELRMQLEYMDYQKIVADETKK